MNAEEVPVIVGWLSRMGLTADQTLKMLGALGLVEEVGVSGFIALARKDLES